MDAAHADVIDFINIKADLNRVTKANISLVCDDNLFRRYKSNQNYTVGRLGYKTWERETEIPARQIIKNLAEMNRDYAEPGMIYKTKRDRYHILSEYPEYVIEGNNP
jgi:ribonucleoside-diphosphate reductase alpha chain